MKQIYNLLEKIFWHTFKVMPGEMILKKKWDTYHKIEKKYYRGGNGEAGYLNSISGSNKNVSENKTIWFYWDKGVGKAPAIVKKCHESLQRHKPNGWDVITVTHETVADYITLPSYINRLQKEGKMWYALYSDLIRLSLLYKYGGIWCDATCYLTQEIPTYVTEEPLFMFSYESLLTSIPAKFENWFIKADKGNYVIEKILESLLYYWSKPHKQQEYFVWFHLQSSLYQNDTKAKEMMDNIFYVFNYDAMLVHIHYGLDSDYDEKKWKYIQNHCFVQKLTYKYDQSLEKTKKMNLIKFILQ